MASRELLDVLDSRGKPTGQRLDKREIHSQGLWHWDTHVWVTTGTHFVEQLRRKDKNIMPGEWDISVGGHVAAGETTRRAARRELAEELGVRVPEGRLIYAGRLAVEMEIPERGKEPWMHRVHSDHYVLVAPDLQREDLKLQRSEVSDARFYPLDQLEKDMRNPNTAKQHASQPPEMWHLGIAAMRKAVRP